MATVVPFSRKRAPNRRPVGSAAASADGARAARWSAEGFWRKSMMPASIGMGVIIVLAMGLLGLGAETGAIGPDAMIWVLIAVMISVVGLSKIIIANVFFLMLIRDDDRVDYRSKLPERAAIRRAVAPRRPERHLRAISSGAPRPATPSNSLR